MSDTPMVTDPSTNENQAPVSTTTAVTSPPPSKGKGKAVPAADEMEEDEEEEDDDEDHEEAEDEDEEIDEDISGTILPPGTRRSTRNAGIDYSSEAALQKAGVTKQELEAEDAEEEDFKMKEDDHHD